MGRVSSVNACGIAFSWLAHRYLDFAVTADFGILLPVGPVPPNRFRYYWLPHP